jgi:hypothetical protein
MVAAKRRPTVLQMEKIFQGLTLALPRIQSRAGARSPFTARVFDDLRILAASLTDRYVTEPA